MFFFFSLASACCLSCLSLSLSLFFASSVHFSLPSVYSGSKCRLQPSRGNRKFATRTSNQEAHKHRKKKKKRKIKHMNTLNVKVAADDVDATSLLSLSFSLSLLFLFYLSVSSFPVYSGQLKRKYFLLTHSRQNAMMQITSSLLIRLPTSQVTCISIVSVSALPARWPG